MAQSKPSDDRDLKAVLERAQSLGRGGDTHLVHVGKREIAVLKAMGGAGTVNPETGLQEFLMGSPGGGPYGGGRDSMNSGGGGTAHEAERTAGGTKPSELKKPAAAPVRKEAKPPAKASGFSDVPLQDVPQSPTAPKPRAAPDEDEDPHTTNNRRLLRTNAPRLKTVDLLRELS